MSDDGIVDAIFKPISFNYFEMLEHYKPDAAKAKVLEALDSAAENLSDVETAMILASYFGDEKIGKELSVYGGKVGEFAGHLARPGSVIKNFQAAMKISQAVVNLRGKISDNPQAAAKAFGKLFSGIGELASYLPFPGAREYLGFFKGAENFFENIRVMSQIEVHIKGENKQALDSDPTP